MKTNLLLAFLLSAFVSVQSFAQNTSADQAGTENRRGMMARTPEERAERQTTQMKKQLSLTADQEKSVAALNLKYAQKMQTMMTGDRSEGAMKQMREAMEGKDAELKALLTADQYKQYETQRDEQRDRMRQGRGGQRNNR